MMPPRLSSATKLNASKGRGVRFDIPDNLRQLDVGNLFDVLLGELRSDRKEEKEEEGIWGALGVDLGDQLTIIRRVTSNFLKGGTGLVRCRAAERALVPMTFETRAALGGGGQSQLASQIWRPPRSESKMLTTKKRN
ncbi:hypothetical protein NL676_016322 [Syzygium grande]|nr:hypothetical protein NL676_016322 [Syzygium grande]